MLSNNIGIKMYNFRCHLGGKYKIKDSLHIMSDIDKNL